MPPRSKVSKLPKEIREWLDKALAESGFCEYRLLSDELAKRGYVISHASIHRYGKNFERRLGSIRLAAAQARVIINESPDDDNTLNEALVRLVQDKLFGVLMDAEIDTKKIDIIKVTRAIADISRASVGQKRWVAEARQTALIDAAEAARVAGKGMGLTDEAADAICQRILGA